MKWLLLLFITLATALDRVNDYNFDKLVKSSGNYVLVDFYADWCRHCQKLMPTIESLSEHYKDIEGVDIYKLNGGDRSGRKSVLRYDIEGFPDIVLFHGDDEPVRYEGSRDFESINNFLILKTGINKVANPDITPVLSNPASTKSLIINDYNIRDEVLNANKPTLVFIGGEWCKHCKEFYPTFDNLKSIFSTDSVQFAEVMLDNEGGSTDMIKQQFGIKNVPAIFLFDPSKVDSDGLRRPIKYDGRRKLREMIRFLNGELNTYRHEDGSGALTGEAGRLPEFEQRIKDISSVGQLNDIVQELTHINTFETNYYSRILNKIKSFDVKAELTRLNDLKNDENISKFKRDEIMKRINILNFFSKHPFN